MKSLVLPCALMAACAGGSDGRPPKIATEPFREMARTSPCADKQNRLFLIDGRIVFWERVGACFDNAYARTLFGGSPQDVLCSVHDSIGGPVKTCPDPSREGLFDLIIEHAEEPDLGLGPEHDVKTVPL